MSKKAMDKSTIINPLKFERLLSELFASFVNIHETEFEDRINYALQRIGEVLKLDQCILLQYIPEKKHWETTHVWVAKGIKRHNAIGVGTADTPWIYRNIALKNKMLKCKNLDELPPEAATDKKLMQKYGIRSFINFPIVENEKPLGAVVLSQVRYERDWPAEVVTPFKRLIEVLLNVLLKKKSEEKLNKAFKEIEKLKNRLESERDYLVEEIKLEYNHENIIGQSKLLQHALLKVEQVAATPTTVLILGETGTGKELLARAIHNKSLLKNHPLIKVNCASLNPNLIESELFGHEKGAFTGAHENRKGRFELADGATLFLDEVGELPIEIQSKLLRVLQEGELERMGSSRTIKVDIRLITATNRNLAEEVEAGRFRKDLWYRLNVFPITSPPLRQRTEDIPELVNWLVNKFCKKIGKNISRVAPSTIKALMDYTWPGNVRELENIIESAIISSSGEVLQLTEKLEPCSTNELSLTQVISISEMEHQLIHQALKEKNWQIEGANGAAGILGLTPSSLRRRMVKYNIKRP